VEVRLVAVFESGEAGRRREECRAAASRARPWRAVATGGDRAEAGPEYEGRAIVGKDDGAVGQGHEIGLVAALLKAAGYGAFAVEAGVKVRGRAGVTERNSIGKKGRAAAELARAVAGGERYGFVEEE
jgi:hypothetical protein